MIKASETKNYLVFNLVFTNNIIWSHFFKVLIPTVIEQVCIAAKFVIPTVIPTKESKAEIETYIVTVEAKMKKCSVLF